MIVGLPKEIKDNEYRVGLTPAGVRALTDAGHRVLVETKAGEGSGFEDSLYTRAGATMINSADDVWAQSEMIVKVKEPIAPEYPRMRDGQLLFTYLHLAPDNALTEQLLDRKVTGVAYETITDRRGTLPLLTPMSEVAGRMAIQVGAHFSGKDEWRRRHPAGRRAGRAGRAGRDHWRRSRGHECGEDRCRHGRACNDDRQQSRSAARAGRHFSFKNLDPGFERLHDSRRGVEADLIVGAVLVPGASAPKLVTRNMLKDVPKGAVLVDVAVDQGGCFETTHPTTHSDPTYYVEEVLHYCVANMPGAVPRTSTFALTNATLPYALKLANHGLQAAVESDPGLKAGVNTYAGKLTYEAVAVSQGREYTPLDQLLPA